MSNTHQMITRSKSIQLNIEQGSFVKILRNYVDEYKNANKKYNIQLKTKIQLLRNMFEYINTNIYTYYIKMLHTNKNVKPKYIKLLSTIRNKTISLKTELNTICTPEINCELNNLIFILDNTAEIVIQLMLICN